MEWDFEAFRRRSSVIGARWLHGRRAIYSVVAAAAVSLNPIVTAAQTKYQTAHTFTRREGEDVVSWIHCYKKVGKYNLWNGNEIRNRVELSLKGAASKWYACMEAAGLRANGIHVWRRWGSYPIRGRTHNGTRWSEGVKPTLSTEFTPVNYVNKAKQSYEPGNRQLRNRPSNTITTFWICAEGWTQGCLRKQSYRIPW